jgi:tetratricopeptide (TPR) repeat protein
LALSPFSMTSRAAAPAGAPPSADAWLLSRVGETPTSSLGWFRAGVGFFNKREFHFAIDCFQRSVHLDPLNVSKNSGRPAKGATDLISPSLLTPLASTRSLYVCVSALVRSFSLLFCLLQYNAFQIMARACIAVNRRDDAIEALKQSVKLDNPSDWQLLVELTAQEKAAKKASESDQTSKLARTPNAAAAMVRDEIGLGKNSSVFLSYIALSAMLLSTALNWPPVLRRSMRLGQRQLPRRENDRWLLLSVLQKSSQNNRKNLKYFVEKIKGKRGKSSH